MRVWCQLPAPFVLLRDELSELQSGFTSVFPTTAGFDLTARAGVVSFHRGLCAGSQQLTPAWPLLGPVTQVPVRGVVEGRLLISICWCVQKRVVGGGRHSRIQERGRQVRLRGRWW